MPCFRSGSRALAHLLRHAPSYHHSSPASLFSRHSPLAPFTHAFDNSFFSSSPLYTVYEVRDEDSSNKTTNSNKAEQQTTQPEETKAAEPQHHQRSSDSRLAHRHEDNHRQQRRLDRRSHRHHRHHHGHYHHHPLSLFSPFDSLLASPFIAQPSYQPQPLEISVDLYSTPSAYQVAAAIPGVRKEDIKLTVEDGVLTIEAERKEERGRPTNTTTASSSSSTSTPPTATASDTTVGTLQADGVDANTVVAETKAQQQQQEAEEEDDVSVHHVESYYGRVQRSLSLPEDVDVEGLTARYEDGVLRIELPRIEEKKQQAKQINIQ